MRFITQNQFWILRARSDWLYDKRRLVGLSREERCELKDLEKRINTHYMIRESLDDAYMADEQEDFQ